MSSSKETFCIYKSLVFDPSSNKFDAKNFAITGVSDCVEEEDVVNLRILKEELSKISQDRAKLELEITSLRSRLKSLDSPDKGFNELRRKIVDLESSLNSGNNSSKLDSMSFQLNTISRQIGTHESILKNQNHKSGILKEVVYEIITNRNNNSSFSIPKKLLDNMLVNNDFNPNLYSKMILKNTALKISLRDSNNVSLHTKKNHLKNPIEIIITSRNKNNSTKNQTIYSGKFDKLATNKNLPKQEIDLPKNFTNMVKVIPERLEECFAQSSEASRFPKVVELTQNIKTVLIKIIFMVEVFYKFDTQDFNEENEDED